MFKCMKNTQKPLFTKQHTSYNVVFWTINDVTGQVESDTPSPAYNEFGHNEPPAHE